MRFEITLVALAATSVAASQPYAPPPAYGETSPSPAGPGYDNKPAEPANPPSYGEQPPYGGSAPQKPQEPAKPSYGTPSKAPEHPGKPSYGGSEPAKPPYGGEPAPVPSHSCSEGHPSETPYPAPTSTEECDEEETEYPVPTGTPCLGYDCPKPNPGGEYSTITTTITTSVPCEGYETCPPVTYTKTIIVPCPQVTTTTYVTKPCPSCEEETVTSTITVTETYPVEYTPAPGAPAPGAPGAPYPPAAPAPPVDSPAAPAPPVDSPEYPGSPSTLVPQPVGTGSPVAPCPGGDYGCAPGGNGTSPEPSVPSYVSGASRFTGSIAAGFTVILAAAFML